MTRLLLALLLAAAVGGCSPGGEDDLTTEPSFPTGPASGIVSVEITPRDSAIDEGDELQALILEFLKLHSRGGSP